MKPHGANAEMQNMRHRTKARRASHRLRCSVDRDTLVVEGREQRLSELFFQTGRVWEMSVTYQNLSLREKAEESSPANGRSGFWDNSKWGVAATICILTLGWTISQAVQPPATGSKGLGYGVAEGDRKMNRANADAVIGVCSSQNSKAIRSVLIPLSAFRFHFDPVEAHERNSFLATIVCDSPKTLSFYTSHVKGPPSYSKRCSVALPRFSWVLAKPSAMASVHQSGPAASH